MKSINFFLFFIYFSLLISCGQNNEKTSDSRLKLKNKITQLEDSIAQVQKDRNNMGKMSPLVNVELINRLIAYFRAFPKDAYAADCLFKIHMKYSELNDHENSVAYGDTLLNNFPKYKNKEFLLESMASAYDVYIIPRDTSKVRLYYSMLLNDPLVKREKKKDLRKRLNHLHLSFDDYILKLNQLP
jgi:hypothetical protein